MTSTDRTFDALNCTSLKLRFEVAKDKFDAERFIQLVKVPRGRAFCHTQLYDTIDYHVHFEWLIDDEDINLSISYHPPGSAPEKDEKEPFAETVVSWIGQFFANDTAHTDVSARFSYNSDERQSRFPLPIRLSVVPDVDAEIDGVSFNLPAEPSGVDGLLILNETTGITVQTKGGARVRFKDFDPIDLLIGVSALVRKFVIMKRQSSEGVKL